MALISEDNGEVPLRQFMRSNRPDLSNFLFMAVQLAQTLAGIHQKQIIHGALTPDNILVHPLTRIVRISDFSSSMRVSGKSDRMPANFIPPAGPLEYMAPERSGRTRYALDQRCDLYSLGVVCYELLTGQLPFQAAEPVEWVHAHLAQSPSPPDIVNPLVLPAIAAIIMKLLAKNPADRYQQAFSLLTDLTECWRHWLQSGTIQPFTLGQADLCGVLRISSRLYGREKEREVLEQVLAAVGTGAAGPVLVTGHAGIGKTALVQATVTPLIKQSGYFISGKFEQFQYNKPYAPLGQAFGQLMRQLLTESPDSLDIWKNNISCALGQSGAVISSIIPEVELLIGSQAPVESLHPREAQNRFRMVFLNFVRVFARQKHPLIIFLDDLQWADTDSLQLLQSLSEARENHLLLIGAYRDNEITDSHPLQATLSALAKGPKL